MCYKHPQTPAVVNCGQCGVGMCAACNSNAYFRLSNSQGQAICDNCSLTMAQENYNLSSSWVKRRTVKIIICTLLCIIGIGAFMFKFNLPVLFISWFLSGVVSSIGQKDTRSTYQQAKDAIDDAQHPIVNTVSKIIGNILFCPIFIIFNLIGLARGKKECKEDKRSLENVRQAISKVDSAS